MRRLRWLVPLGIFVVLLVFLGVGLTRDPREVPSPLVGKPAPGFDLPRLAADDTAVARFSPADMKGKVWMLNVWASWCVSCREEHPVLLDLAKRGVVPLVGLNYKDGNADARRWLARHGNPYQLSAIDADGRVVFGSTVEIEDLENGTRNAYQIVGDDEADIKASKISVNSPIARALIGKSEGDTAEVQAPGGIRSFEVVGVRYA